MTPAATRTALQHLAGGMATAALFTCMMDWCSRESSATDYTVQASAVIFATGTASVLAGFSAQALGYLGHFCLAAGLALGAVAVAHWCYPSPRKAQRAGGRGRWAAPLGKGDQACCRQS